ncbi:olfactory receptor 5AP2-like [Ambystoma mexicanum]|uniref:olfactory receptor 5AP2-like n=1 Tax=Ambystoma mexicanum TaxID=8296 RepID=UPI0037E8D09B
MKHENGSSVAEFILEGLTPDMDLQVLLFMIFMPVYVSTLLGNISIMAIIWLDPRLHKPMYFFLGSLSIIDLGFSSTSSPKMLADMLTREKSISLYGCVTQLIFYAGFGSTEFFLLAVMAYDRYVAICNPLLYSVTMRHNLCIQLIAASYIGGFLNSLIHAGCFFRLHFCGPNIIDHFMCDYPVVLKLSCNDFTINELVRIVFASVVMVISLLIVLISYTFILAAVLKIRTAAGRSRAFSTCASHFTCVSMFYGTILFMELRLNSSSTHEQDKVVALFSTILIPVLNPLIYSLRNQDVKEALKKIFSRTMFFL